jgi:NTP pyrophosphatase (non-canonical NTP hydrolase)
MKKNVCTPTDDAKRLSVVLCGSFRKDLKGLTASWTELCDRFRVLSPLDVSWVDPEAEFVRVESEIGTDASVLERRHLDAIQLADFVWLHCPAGYVGQSAALEVGYAHALGIPILCETKPTDEVLASMVTTVDGGPSLAASHIVSRPGSGIAGLQRYYARTAERRGWSDESPRDTLLLLTEELGELARAVRKESGLKRDSVFPEGEVGAELADVQLYLVHLATALGVDLAAAVTAKELVNAERFAKRVA